MVAVIVASAWSCMTVTDVELLEISSTGVIFGQAFLDQNGSGVADAGDAPLRSAAVQLVAAGTSGQRPQPRPRVRGSPCGLTTP